MAQAAPVLSDNFEYADQAAYDAAWPPVSGVTGSGVLSTTQAFSPTKSIFIPTTATNNQNRGQRTFTETVASSGDNVEFKFRFYDVETSIVYRQYANLQDGTAPSSSGQLISMGLNNNLTSSTKYMARVLGVNGGAYFPLDDAGAPTRSVGWHELKAVISPTDIKFYVDDLLSKTIDASGWATRSYDVVRLGSGLSTTRDAYFDDLSVSLVPVPEPGTLGAASIAALGLLARRRRA